MKYGARIPHLRRVVGKLWSEFHYSIGQYLVAGTGYDGDPEDVGNPFAMVDLDSLEYCQRCRKQIALFELKHADERVKTWTQTRRLGNAADLPVYLVVMHTDGNEKLVGFQVYDSPKMDMYQPLISPHDMAVWVTNLHRPHTAKCSAMRSHFQAIDQIRMRLAGETA